MLLKGYQGEWMKQKMDYATIDFWESSRSNRDAWGGSRPEWDDPLDIRPLMERFRAYAEPSTFRTYEFEMVS